MTSAASDLPVGEDDLDGLLRRSGRGAPYNALSLVLLMHSVPRMGLAFGL